MDEERLFRELRRIQGVLWVIAGLVGELLAFLIGGVNLMMIGSLVVAVTGVVVFCGWALVLAARDEIGSGPDHKEATNQDPGRSE